MNNLLAVQREWANCAAACRRHDLLQRRWLGGGRWDRSGWRRPGGMPCVVCREVVVGAVCATVHATDDYLRWASSHCARTPATANGDPALAQPRPAHRGVRRPLISTTPVSDARRHLPRTIRAQRAQRAPSRASSFPCTSTRTSFRPSPMALHKFT